jgi:hypothetical protein
VGYALIGILISTFDQKHWPAVRSNWYGHKAAWISLTIIVIFWIARNFS